MKRSTFVIFGIVVLLFGVGIPAWALTKEGSQDSAAENVPSGLQEGKDLFVINCGACHTLAEAGTDGVIGPNLDELLAPPSASAPDPATIKPRVLAAINNGVAWLALNSGATVVPVAILGTRIGGEHLDTVPAPRRRLHVSFGGAINVSRRPGETGRVSMDRAGIEIRAALARHVQDSVLRTGQSLPHAESPHERHEAVAGTPADHHLRKVQ